MSTTTTTTTTPDTPYDQSITAMGDIRSEAHRWTLAEALLSEVGPGDARDRFKTLARIAEGRGVKPLGLSAMRQYRDVAAAYPDVASRIPGASFSAHRAALGVREAGGDPRKLLESLQNAGTSLTVSNVRAEVDRVKGVAPKREHLGQGERGRGRDLCAHAGIVLALCER